LSFLPEVVGLPSEIFFHGERRRLGQTRQQACTYACGDSAAKKSPQHAAAIDCIHCSSPCRMSLSSTVRMTEAFAFDQLGLDRLPAGSSLGISPGR
jgi:hypothetical protein